jgi:hypothetical protein
MNRRTWLIGSGVTAIAALIILILATGLTLAQGVTGDTREVGIAQAVEVAAPSDYIPIQGRLTDASGNPLNGSYVLTFRLYGSSSGGSSLCEDSGSVDVENGLFSSYMKADACPIDGRRLYLGIEVEDDGEMTPRAYVDNVPYAWTLRPGAVVSDSLESAVLTARNNGVGYAINAESKTGDSAAVRGANLGLGDGVWGTSIGAAGVKGAGLTGVGVQADSFVGVALKATGTGVIQSSAKSYLWISGNNLVKASTDDTTKLVRDLYGGFRISGGSGWATPKVVALPITIYGQLYGQDVTVTDVDLYYTVSADLTAITTTNMRRQDGVGAGDLVFSDGTDLTCVPGAQCSKHWNLSQNNVLNNQRGILYLAFELGFPSSTDYVQIGGVRLTLEHE